MKRKPGTPVFLAADAKRSKIVHQEGHFRKGLGYTRCGHPLGARQAIWQTTDECRACPTQPALARAKIDGMPLLAGPMTVERLGLKIDSARRCALCDCTQELACAGGCAWLPGDGPFICTSCAGHVARRLVTYVENGTLPSWNKSRGGKS